MRKISRAVPDIGSTMLLMMRYRAVRISAAHLGRMLCADSSLFPRKLHHSECVTMLPARLMEILLLAYPYEETLGGMADGFLCLKDAIERKAFAACPAQQQRLIEVEYQHLASEIRRRADCLFAV